MTVNPLGIFLAMRFSTVCIFLCLGLPTATSTVITVSSHAAPVEYKVTDQCKQASGKDRVTISQISFDEGHLPLLIRSGTPPQVTSIFIGPSLNAMLIEVQDKRIVHCNDQFVTPNFILVEKGTAYSLFMLDEFAVVRLHIHSHLNCGTSCYYSRVDTIAIPAGDWEVRGYFEMKSQTYEYPSKWFRAYLLPEERAMFDKIIERG
jgi:hypothetical protein